MALEEQVEAREQLEVMFGELVRKVNKEQVWEYLKEMEEGVLDGWEDEELGGVVVMLQQVYEANRK